MNKRRRFKAKKRRKSLLMVNHVTQRIRQAETEMMSIETYVNLNRLMRQRS